MKQPITLVSFLLFFFGLFLLPANAQTSYIIGVHNGENTATSYPTPYGDYSEQMRAQYLYLASELSAAGASSGYITGIGFLVSNPNGIGEVNNMRIYLSNSAVSDLDSLLWEPAGDLVYDTLVYQPTAGGNLHILTTPFLWDGVSNIVLEICQSPIDPGNGNFASSNASVQWTPDLSFRASKTFHTEDYPDVCGTSDISEDANAFTRPVAVFRFSCLPPAFLTAVGISSTGATLNWGNVPGANNFIYEVGPAGFTPGTGAAVVADTLNDITAIITGLASVTDYEAYIRTECAPGIYSDWIGPVDFTTSPGCGDTFYDTGDSTGNYANGEHYFTTICASDSLEVPTIQFQSFNLVPGDTLRLYNGIDASFPLFGAFTGTTAPGPFTVTSATGCMTLEFASDADSVGAGWQASISCAPPDSCFSILDLNLTLLSPIQAQFTWFEVFGAVGYEWQLTLPNGTVIYQGITTNSFVKLVGLTEATYYIFRIRVLCSSSNTSWTTINFNTPLECDLVPTVICGSGVSGLISSVGSGLYPDGPCGFPTPGKERILRFTAPNTRKYIFQIVFAANSSYVSYGFKDATEGCGEDGWKCIGSFNSVNDEAEFGELVAGHEYLILFDPETTGLVGQTFRIHECLPTNDEPWTAIGLGMDTPCSGNVYSNEGATFNFGLGEANPDTSGTGRWLTPADATVWFSFIAPASGSVTIYSEGSPPSLGTDTQLALYEASDSSDFSTFHLLASDDDNGVSSLGYNSEFSYTGLVPGKTYYIQVDGFSTFENPFCIAVSENIVRVEEQDCSTTFSLANVDGTTPDGDHWYTIYTAPDILDLGNIVAAIKPGPQDLDTVFCMVANVDSIPISLDHIPYMPMYFHFSWSNTLATGPVMVRLFFHDAEFDSLKVVANKPAATIDDLNATHYAGVNEDCSHHNNNFTPGIGTATLITNVDALEIGTSGLFYVDVTIPGPGEVGVHLGNIPLPLELTAFSGKIMAQSNLLSWTTSNEQQVSWHILERSADGLKWAEVGRKQGAYWSETSRQYQVEDLSPLPSAYYRLRSIDFDGTVSVSKSILLKRREAFGIAAVYPSPVSDQVTVQYAAVSESTTMVRVTDLNGKLQLEQSADSRKGMNTIRLNLAALPAGVYLIGVYDDTNAATPVKVVKQ